jgi:16S rRNA processing protein RimM
MASRRREIAARRRGKREQSPPGAPTIGAPGYLQVGILRRPHGVSGEMLMAVVTDFPERIQPGSGFFLGRDHQAVTINSVRSHNKGLLIRLNEYPNVESIEYMRNTPLYSRAADLPPLPEGEYYQHQLIGLRVVNETGKELGVLAGFLETGANDVYQILTSEGKELLLPNIPDVVLSVDVPAGQITVHILDGLIE